MILLGGSRASGGARSLAGVVSTVVEASQAAKRMMVVQDGWGQEKDEEGLAQSRQERKVLSGWV